jgi:ATP-dependent Clp protease ATP-binding subunit ClpA
MYERFTDRARKVMQLANQEAQRLNHDCVDTEHVLLGLMKEGFGSAARILRTLDMDLRQCRLALEKLVGPGSPTAKPGKLPQAASVTRLVYFAVEEARNLSHDRVDTEHLLLGLLRETDGVAAKLLVDLGFSLDDVRVRAVDLMHAASELPAFRSSYAELHRLPGETVLKLIALDSEIEKLKLKKADALAERDFAKSDELRAALDRLGEDRLRLIEKACLDLPFASG